MLSIYPACFYKEEGGYSVIFPDLNGIATCGATLEEAMRMAIDLLAGELHTRKNHKEPIPTPSEPSAITLQSVYNNPGILESFVSMVSVDVAEYARSHFEKSVKKTLSIPAYLNTAAQQAGINFSSVLQNALKAELHLA